MQMWTGLWRALFMLQTFAHHFNYVQGQIDIPTLKSELNDSCAALALQRSNFLSYLVCD